MPKEKKPETVKVKVLYSSFSWDDVETGEHRTAEFGDVIELPENHPALLEGIRCEKFKLVQKQ